MKKYSHPYQRVCFITHPCLKFKNGLVISPLRLRNGRVFTYNRITWVWLFRRAIIVYIKAGVGGISLLINTCKLRALNFLDFNAADVYLHWCRNFDSYHVPINIGILPGFIWGVSLWPGEFLREYVPFQPGSGLRLLYLFKWEIPSEPILTSGINPILISIGNVSLTMIDIYVLSHITQFLLQWIVGPQAQQCGTI